MNYGTVFGVRVSQGTVRGGVFGAGVLESTVRGGGFVQIELLSARLCTVHQYQYGDDPRIVERRTVLAGGPASVRQTLPLSEHLNCTGDTGWRHRETESAAALL